MRSDHGRQGFRQKLLVEPNSPVTQLLHEFDFCAEVGILDGFCDIAFGLRLENTEWEDYSKQYGDKCFLDLFEDWKTSENGTTFKGIPRNSNLGDGELVHFFELGRPSLFSMCRTNLKGEYVDLWPFCGWTHTMCRSANYINTSGCFGREGGPAWCQYHRCKFSHERFARKQARKEDKRLGWPERKLRRKRVPGAWVE